MFEADTNFFSLCKRDGEPNSSTVPGFDQNFQIEFAARSGHRCIHLGFSMDGEAYCLVSQLRTDGRVNSSTRWLWFQHGKSLSNV